jgi:hypothetical protein
LQLILTEQIAQADVPALLRENPSFAEWYCRRRGIPTKHVSRHAAYSPTPAETETALAAARLASKPDA